MYYTYSALGFGVMPDTVYDYDTLEDAVQGFLSEVETTAEYADADYPDDVPTVAELTHAADNGGLAYGFGGYLHVIGKD